MPVILAVVDSRVVDLVHVLLCLGGNCDDKKSIDDLWSLGKDMVIVRVATCRQESVSSIQLSRGMDKTKCTISCLLEA